MILPHNTPPHSVPDLAGRALDLRNRYKLNQRFLLQCTAAACSSLSILAAFITFYWFFRMKKRFRHRLIMFVMCGDFIRATWYFLFAVVALTKGPIRTRSSICQASGFFIQFGTEASDYSVLMIAIHSAMQVFLPASTSRSDGLFSLRYYIYAGAIFFPSLLSGLAFINPEWGYMSEGAFCALPLRPYWYRLALAWIPRYLIAIVIVGLAIAIYTYVGLKFRSFNRANMSTKTSNSTLLGIETPALLHTNPGTRARSDHGGSCASEFSQTAGQTHRRNSAARSSTRIKAATRGLSDQGVVPAFRSNGDIFKTTNDGSGVFDPVGHCTHSPYATNHRRSLGTNDSQEAVPPDATTPNLDRRRISLQRHRINRQLRLMFIYPLVYVLMWILPFINHCFHYQDSWAQSPFYPLVMLSTICVTIMGAVDCLIFNLREKPWRHISDSNSTFLRSFRFWHEPRRSDERRNTGDSFYDGGHLDVPDTSATSTVGPALAFVARHSRVSKSSDREKDAVDRARVRLNLEREDRLKAHRAKEDDDAQMETATLEQDTAGLSTIISNSSVYSNSTTNNLPGDQDSQQSPETTRVATAPV